MIASPNWSKEKLTFLVLVRLGGLFFAPSFSWGVLEEKFSTSALQRGFSRGSDFNG